MAEIPIPSPDLMGNKFKGNHVLNQRKDKQ